MLLRCSFFWDRVPHHWTILKQHSGLISNNWMSNINSAHYWITWFQDSELLFWYLLKALYCTLGPNLSYVRGGADKSLTRPTFQCRRTESTASLERGVCSCAELQVFSCYRGCKEACQATRAISTTSKRELSSSFCFFPARQGAEGNPRHSDRNIKKTCTIICHRQKLGGPV